MTMLAAWDWHRFTKFDVWGVLFWVNSVVLVALVIIAVMALVRDRQERAPANLVPFHDDEDLETRRLERVLGWALVFSAVLAVSYGAYWLREPTRQEGSFDYFDEGAVERGEVLFANKSMEAYDSAFSLACADCHGSPAEDPDLGKEVAAGGGSAPNVYADPDQEKSFAAAWKAPALNTVLYRVSPDEVKQVLIYGRPGTPMAAWGTAGNGPKNDQSINDLVAYLASIQLTPEEAQQKAAAELERAKTAAAAQLAAAETALEDANAAVPEAEEKLATAEAALAALDDETSAEYVEAQRAVTKADRGVEQANEAVTTATTDLAWAQEWADRRAGVTDGQLLFELNCARCHTQNWSVFNPSNADLPPEDLLGKPGGGGSLGFNLANVLERFADILNADGERVEGSGVTNQHDFIAGGSDANQPYGIGGGGSGRMPGQCNTDTADPLGLIEHRGCQLTPEMIDAIVAYERCGLPAMTNEYGAAEYDEDCA